MGRRGVHVFYSFKWFLPAFAALIGGGGGSAPCGTPSTQAAQKEERVKQRDGGSNHDFFIPEGGIGGYRANSLQKNA